MRGSGCARNLRTRARSPVGRAQASCASTSLVHPHVLCSSLPHPRIASPPAPCLQVEGGNTEASPPAYSTLQRVELGGHRSDVRTCALSADGLLLATASNNALKVRLGAWDLRGWAGTTHQSRWGGGSGYNP